MKRDELKQLIQGVILGAPTPFDDEFHVDHGRMAEFTQWWVEKGAVTGKAVLMVASLMGENAQLRDSEWPPLLRTVVQAAKGKVPILCGSAHHKDTLRTIEDTKIAQDLGAIGVQVPPPMHNDPTQDDVLRFYEAVSNAIDIGIVVYNTHWERRGNLFGLITPDTFRKMSSFEQVVAIKWSYYASDGFAYEEMENFAQTFNILDNGPLPVLCHKLGGRGYVNRTAVAHPAYDLRFWELLESRRYEEAQAWWEKVNTPLDTFHGKVARRSGGDARVPKGLMTVMGHAMGAPRPPSEPLNAEELTELRELATGWGWPVPEQALA